jgi:hypothetical protein
MRQLLISAVAITAALLGTKAPALAQNSEPSGQPAQASQVEEIYIARSVRLSQVEPTNFCAEAKTSFKANREDQFEFRTTSVRTSDGRMLDAYGKVIASGHGCTGPTNDSAIIAFYLELRLGSNTLKGIGDCRRTKVDFPERGLRPTHCQLNLSDTLGKYVGGQLTTNTMGSRRLLGPDSDPAGYVQPSIATIRLWKKRP